MIEKTVSGMRPHAGDFLLTKARLQRAGIETGGQLPVASSDPSENANWASFRQAPRHWSPSGAGRRGQAKASAITLSNQLTQYSASSLRWMGGASMGEMPPAVFT